MGEFAGVAVGSPSGVASPSGARAAGSSDASACSAGISAGVVPRNKKRGSATGVFVFGSSLVSSAVAGSSSVFFAEGEAAWEDSEGLDGWDGCVFWLEDGEESASSKSLKSRGDSCWWERESPASWGLGAEPSEAGFTGNGEGEEGMIILVFLSYLGL